MRTCPKCGSIFVCWNWGRPTNDSDTTWYHECWICDWTFPTDGEVLDGLSYEQLRHDFETKY